MTLSEASTAQHNPTTMDISVMQTNPMLVNVSRALPSELHRIAEDRVLQQFPNANHILSLIAKNIYGADAPNVPAEKVLCQGQWRDIAHSISKAGYI